MFSAGYLKQWPPTLPCNASCFLTANCARPDKQQKTNNRQDDKIKNEMTVVHQSKISNPKSEIN